MHLGYDPIGCCAEYTEAFAQVFPELKRVYGEVTLRSGAQFPHWWMETPEGTIFDPTASQFDQEYYWYAGIKSYRKFSEEELAETQKWENALMFPITRTAPVLP